MTVTTGGRLTKVVLVAFVRLRTQGRTTPAARGLRLRGDDWTSKLSSAPNSVQGVVVDRLRRGHHLAQVEHDLDERGRVGIDLLGEVAERSAARHPNGFAVAARSHHAADRRRLHVVELLTPLLLGLAAAGRTSAGTTERASRAAAASAVAATAWTTRESAGSAGIATATTTAGATATRGARPAAVRRTGTTGAPPPGPGASTGTAAGSARACGAGARGHHGRIRPRSAWARGAGDSPGPRPAGAQRRPRDGRGAGACHARGGAEGVVAGARSTSRTRRGTRWRAGGRSNRCRRGGGPGSGRRPWGQAEGPVMPAGVGADGVGGATGAWPPTRRPRGPEELGRSARPRPSSRPVAFFAGAAALRRLGGGAGKASFSFLTTGASMVEDAERTNSPMSCSLVTRTLLSTPSSFASS